MKQKILTTIFALILLISVGMVSADRVISDLEGINIPIGNVFAGGSFEASFSFNYFDAPENEEDSPLIIKLNITSDNEFYPVNKNEFWISGVAKRYTFFGLIPIKNVSFECNESTEQTIDHPKDVAFVTAPNGTFYCYNEEGDLSLNEKDEISLIIRSHQAIYPGNYTLSAKLFYLIDERAPFVNITNKDVFDRYYREVDNIEILATINDGSEIINKWGEAFLPSETITFPFTHENSGIYHFSRNTPEDIAEGDYLLFVFAEDEHNNMGNDSTTLKIDRTGPMIEVIQPNGSIYDEILPIELNVSDVKAGVNNQSIYYKLREMNGTSICPEDGIGTWDCYNSGWINLALNSTTETYKTDINTTQLGMESGEYWFEAKAEDILGNQGVLE